MTSRPIYLNSKQVAERLCISVDTVKRWKSIGHGPQPIRIGIGPRGRLLWLLAEVELFEEKSVLNK